MADKQLDIHEVTCKVCGLSKKRIRSGKYKKDVGYTPRWVGESGKLWNGLTCPDCHQSRAAVNMYNKRSME